MNHGISYRINYKKAIEVIVWIAASKPGIDIYHIAKVLFYAEKAHVNKYARPIIGDRYICMDYGPVPSAVKNLINKDSWLDPGHLSDISNSIIVHDYPHKNIEAKREPDLKYFSGTDLECLEESLKEYGDKSFDELKNLTHNEFCWIESEPNEAIDYSLMVDSDNPDKEEILEEMSETAAYLVM